MARKTPLGRLLIVFGPDAENKDAVYAHAGRFRSEKHQHTSLITDYHARAWADSADVFDSVFFGAVIRELLSGSIVILRDGAFEEQRRRSKVEMAFKRVFPELGVDQVQVGGGAQVGPPDERIIFDGDVYDEGDHGGSNESIVVESDADPVELRSALFNATARMMRVGEDGLEYPDLTVSYAPGGGCVNNSAEHENVYTANSVSAVTEDENGNLGFYIDCKGGIEPPMAEKFRQVLLEEFRKHGISSAHVRVPGSV